MSSGSFPPCGCSSASFVDAGPASTSFSSRSAVVRMISFARATSVTPGSCTRIWSPELPYTRDVRLGDAQLVDAAVDRLARLHDRLLAHRPLDVGLQLELVRAAGARAAIVIRAAACSSAMRRNSASRSGGMPSTWNDCGEATVIDAERHAGGAQRLADLLGRRRRVNPQRVVGLHAQDEMHAALEVEPEAQLLGHQPGRRRQVVAAAPGSGRPRRRRRR